VVVRSESNETTLGQKRTASALCQRSAFLSPAEACHAWLQQGLGPSSKCPPVPVGAVHCRSRSQVTSSSLQASQPASPGSEWSELGPMSREADPALTGSGVGRVDTLTAPRKTGAMQGQGAPGQEALS
jgi:hypothetical protein